MFNLPCLPAGRRQGSGAARFLNARALLAVPEPKVLAQPGSYSSVKVLAQPGSYFFLLLTINLSEYFFLLVLLPRAGFPQGVFGPLRPIGDRPSPPPCG